MEKPTVLLTYNGDYLAETAGLSCEEHGAHLLLMLAYQHQGPLPKDIDALCRITAGCEAETVINVLHLHWHEPTPGLLALGRKECS